MHKHFCGLRPTHPARTRCSINQPLSNPLHRIPCVPPGCNTVQRRYVVVSSCHNCEPYICCGRSYNRMGRQCHGRRYRRKMYFEFGKPRVVMCELSCMRCCLRPGQHDTQHMQITKEKEKLVKSHKRPSGPFARRPVGIECTVPRYTQMVPKWHLAGEPA